MAEIRVDVKSDTKELGLAISKIGLLKKELIALDINTKKLQSSMLKLKGGELNNLKAAALDAKIELQKLNFTAQHDNNIMQQMQNIQKNAALNIRNTANNLKYFNQTLAKSNQLAVGNMFKPMTTDLTKFRDKLKSLTGPFLSMLFFGMMLKNTFTSALKSIFEGYSKATGAGSYFNQQTERLSANWAYFKYQLADAFANSSFFTFMINALIKINQWFQALPEPIKSFIVILMIVIAVFGGILMIVGQLGLGLFGLITAAELFGATTIAAIGSIIVTIGALLVLFALLFYLFDLNSSHLEDLGLEIDGFWNNVLSIIYTFIAGLINIFISLISIIAAIFITIGAVIVGTIKVAITTIWTMIKKLATAIWSALKAAFSGEDISDAFMEGWDSVNIVNAMKDSFDESVKYGKDALSGLATIATGAFGTVNEWEYNKQKGLSNTGDTTTNETTNVTNNFFSYDDALSQGIITQEQYDMAQKNGYIAG